MTTNRPLRVFLCHSSSDKTVVRQLYQKLRAEEWIYPWLDEEELYPGQDWNMEIEKAVEASDAIIVCLTKNSINKEGYVQRELRIVLDFADYKPEGTLYIIPVRLEECEPPRRLRAWQYADYFEGQRDRAFQRLLSSLKKRAELLELKLEEIALKKEEKKAISPPSPLREDLSRWPIVEDKQLIRSPQSLSVVKEVDKITLSNGMEFVRVPLGRFLMGTNDTTWYESIQQTVTIPYDLWVARYPVTNDQYNDYITANGIKHPVLDWKNKKDHPVVNTSWKDANNYCRWLNTLVPGKLPSGLIIRLPTEKEWEKAARGIDGRMYPSGNMFSKYKCNSVEGDKNDTTPIGLYSPQGDSPYGCADMVGNVNEWTLSVDNKVNIYLNYREVKASGYYVARGGYFGCSYVGASCVAGMSAHMDEVSHMIGFRVVIAPSSTG